MADIAAKIKAVEAAHAAIADKSATVKKLQGHLTALDSHTEPVLENGQLVDKPSDTIVVQWVSGGETRHARVSVAGLKSLVEAKTTEELNTLNAVDVDAIIAAEKAKG